MFLTLVSIENLVVKIIIWKYSAQKSKQAKLHRMRLKTLDIKRKKNIILPCPA